MQAWDKKVNVVGINVSKRQGSHGFGEAGEPCFGQEEFDARVWVS